MDTLLLKLRKNGYDYSQVLRGEIGCIYSQSINDKIIAFEVFIIRSRPKRKVFNNWVDANEFFPANEDFGSFAKTSCSYDRAKELFDEAEKERYNRFPIKHDRSKL